MKIVHIIALDQKWSHPGVTCFSKTHRGKTLQTSFPQKPLGQSKPNCMWTLNGLGEQVYSPHLGHMIKMATHLILVSLSFLNWIKNEMIFFIVSLN